MIAIILLNNTELFFTASHWAHFLVLTMAADAYSNASRNTYRKYWNYQAIVMFTKSLEPSRK